MLLLLAENCKGPKSADDLKTTLNEETAWRAAVCGKATRSGPTRTHLCSLTLSLLHQS